MGAVVLPCGATATSPLIMPRPCGLEQQAAHSCQRSLSVTVAMCTCIDPKMPSPLKVTCVRSPSSLKDPMSKVPTNARPRAALAVGAVLCR